MSVRRPNPVYALSNYGREEPADTGLTGELPPKMIHYPHVKILGVVMSFDPAWV